MPGLGVSNARVIEHGGRFQVVRGRWGEVGTPAIAKRALTPDAAAALRHEYTLLRRVEGPGVAKAIAMVEEDGHPLLVLEDAGPEDLAAVIAEGGPLSIETFLHIAVRLAETLVRLHAASIVHRDVCPENVVLRAPHEPTLVDFDLATDVVTVVSPSAPDALQSTIETMSPEQTGRLNRVVDARSDLYSLGATYYAMLTGTAAFPEATPAAVVQAHLTRIPASASAVNPLVPEPLSAIVDRLLAKLPERRYQSAAALAEDLRTARTRWYAHRSIEPFELGVLDRASVLGLPARLYGRDAELEALRDALRRVRAGARELVTLVGEPGAGKSALLDAFEARAGGPVLRGRFGEPGGAPYSALAAAFDSRLDTIAHEPLELASARKRRIALALGANGAVLAEVLPALRWILGPSPPAPPARPAECALRFRLTFVALARALAEPEIPLVLLIDDAQWADSASLEVLRAIATDPEASHVLLVVASRPEPLPEPALESGAHVTPLTLSPLSPEAVTSYVADALGTDRARAGPLADIVYRHSAGVPLLVGTVLSSLHERGLLVHDERRGAWEWDLRRITALPLPRRAVEVLVSAIHRLPLPAQRALGVAACIGRSFELGLVAAIEDEPVEASARRLWVAVRAGVLLPSEPPRARTPAYRFVHDRVQQAAYELIPEAQRGALHLRVGRALRAWSRDEDDALFAVVEQLERGAEAIEQDDERLELAALELEAGLRARSSAAYGPALEYFERGIAILPDGVWSSHHELAFDLHRNAVECCYVTGDRERLDALASRAERERLSILERAELSTLRVSALTQDGLFDQATARGREGLATLGVALPPHIDDAALGGEIERIDSQLRARGREALLDTPRTDDPLVRAKSALLSETATALYFLDPDLSTFADVAVLPMTIRDGLTSDTATALIAVARYLVAMRGDRERASELAGLALEVARRSTDRARESEVLANVGIFIQPWHAPLRSSVPLLRRAFELGVVSGGMTFAAYARTYEAMVRFSASEALPAVAIEAEAAYALAQRMGNPIAARAALMLRQATRCLRGTTATPFTLDDESYDDAKLAPLMDLSPITAHYRHRLLLELAVTFGKFDEARRHAEACAQYTRFVRGMFAHASAHFFGAIARAASDGDDPIAQLREDHALIASWARGCPESFGCMERAIAAEIARIEGRTTTSFDLYDQAIALAVEERSARLEALVCERAAVHEGARGRGRAAALHRTAARDAYARWGATAKVRLIEATLPASLPAEPSLEASARVVTELELSTVQRASDEIISALEWEPLLDRILVATRDVAGATRTALVLVEDGEHALRGILEEGALRATPMRAKLGAGAPIAVSAVEDALRTGEAVHRIDAGAAMSDPYLTRHEVRALLAMPVQRQGVVTGVIYLEHRVSPRAFDGEPVAAVALLAAQVAIALENSALFGQLRRELDQRRRTEARVRFLSDAGMALAESLEMPATLRRVALLSVERIADFCAIDLCEGAVARRVAEASTRGVERSLADGAPRFQPPPGSPLSAEAGARALLVPALSREDLALLSTDPEHVTALRELALRSMIAVPIVARGVTLGAITIAASRRRVPYGSRDLSLMEELAMRAALAIENARSYRDAREAVRLRDEFLSVASHELRGPISALQLTLQGLTSGLLPQLPASASRPLAIAERQTHRLARLVEELLDVSRLRAQKLFLRLEPISLADLVSEIAERFEGELGKAGCTLSVSIPPEVVGVWDPLRLGQVIENLLSNAIKFGRGAPIAIRGEARRGVARLVVSDHGVGIPTERIPFIFDRFERAVSPEHFGGLGLGLYIVRELVGALGGRVEVESVEGEGSTFTVYLPLRGPHQASVEEAHGRTA